jgi:hypothetical protein
METVPLSLTAVDTTLGARQQLIDLHLSTSQVLFSGSNSPNDYGAWAGREVDCVASSDPNVYCCKNKPQCPAASTILATLRNPSSPVLSFNTMMYGMPFSGGFRCTAAAAGTAACDTITVDYINPLLGVPPAGLVAPKAGETLTCADGNKMFSDVPVKCCTINGGAGGGGGGVVPSPPAGGGVTASPPPAAGGGGGGGSTSTCQTGGRVCARFSQQLARSKYQQHATPYCNHGATCRPGHAPAGEYTCTADSSTVTGWNPQAPVWLECYDGATQIEAKVECGDLNNPDACATVAWTPNNALSSLIGKISQCTRPEISNPAQASACTPAGAA